MNGFFIDWHILSSGKPNQNKAQAKIKNVETLWRYTECVFEIANEPNGDVNWNRDIKPYTEEVISEIRKHDTDNVIIVGTGTWIQDVNDAADNPLQDKNVMYIRFYAGPWPGAKRQSLKKARRF